LLENLLARMAELRRFDITASNGLDQWCRAQGFDPTDTVSMLLDRVAANPASLVEPEFFNVGVRSHDGAVREVIVDIDVPSQRIRLGMDDEPFFQLVQSLSTDRTQ
jgi:hypothetical protein